MDKIYYLLVCIIGGVLAGMGMGGGTLTIPLLVIALSTEQLTAQFINLLAFLPAGCAALVVHLKNGLVEGKNVKYLLLFSVLAAAATSYFALSAGAILGKLFGGFLIVVALFSLISDLLKKA